MMTSTNSLNRFYQGLSTLQNLFVLGKVSKVAHQFSAWFIDRDYALENFSVSDDGTIARAQTGNWYGGLCLPSKEPLPPIPEKVKALAENVEKLVKTNHPNLSNLKIRYSGYGRLIEVSELILRSPSPIPQDAEVVYSKQNMLYDTENKSFEMKNGEKLPTWAKYVYDHLKKDENGMPLVIPFYLSQEKLGNSLLMKEDYSPDENEDLHRLQQVVLRTLSEIDNQSYKNDWYALEQKPKEILPKGYQQRIYFEIQLYGNGQSKQIIAKEKATFEFKTCEAYRQVVSKVVEVASFKVTGTVSLSLKENTIHIVLKRNQQIYEELCGIKGKLIIDEKNGNVAIGKEWKILFPEHKRNKIFNVGKEEDTEITSIEVYEERYLTYRF